MKTKKQISSELNKLQGIIHKSEDVSERQLAAMKTYVILAWVLDKTHVAPSKFEDVVEKETKKRLESKPKENWWSKLWSDK